METFENEQELLNRMAHLIRSQTGLLLDNNTIKELLLEVQREQLKGLVYKAYVAVNEAAMKEEQQNTESEDSSEE